jgi:hypothetical protein
MKNKQFGKKKEYIDLKKLHELVPAEFLPKINLLFNKDIPKQPNTANELIIYRLAQLKETNIQQHFQKQFNLEVLQLKKLNKFNELEFVQIDNGDGAAGNLTNIQRMALFSRKKAEGSKKGFSDIMILYYSAKLNYRDTVYCEVKKIGAPSEIHLTEEQLYWFLKLNRMGFDAYITNNPIFFENVILKKIKSFFQD